MDPVAIRAVTGDFKQGHFQFFSNSERTSGEPQEFELVALAEGERLELSRAVPAGFQDRFLTN